MHAVRAGWKMQKLVGLLSVRNGFEVFVAVKVHGDDYVRTPTANSFYIKRAQAPSSICETACSCVSVQ